jgi:subtilase family serine protease
VDEAQLTVLKGNTHPLARPQFDLGTAPADLPMQRMLLVLRRSPQQESALRKLLDDQQDKSSPSYHKWLTPEQFGQQFGPADADLQTITSWLQSHGFQVGSTKGRTVLEFSGSAGQVQEAFHTTIHKYLVNSEQHWANASDPSIPAALTPAVAGVLTLHNFIKKPAIHFSGEAVPAKLVPGKKRPQVTFTENGQVIHALEPADFEVIYGMNSVTVPSLSTIAVVGRSNLYSDGQDVSNFLGIFGGGSFSIMINGSDPGDLGGGEEAEATLDSSWSVGLASSATVHLVVSATTNTTDGIDLSEAFIVENDLAAIMTESFSACELYATDTQLAGASALAEQAAAQGITYIVSTGDSGAEGCDDPEAPPATHPISVNYLASTAFNVAVGGTMFNEDGEDSKYWSSSPPISETALSYIPENVWNESSATNGLWASSGGASAGNVASGIGTTGGVSKPSWQAGVAGIPQDQVRDLPDVSLTAASHDPYVLCLEGSCVPNSQGYIYVYFISGTSAAAPSFAGIMAFVDEQNAQATGNSRVGQASYVLYRLAATQSEYPSQCNGSNTSAPPASICIFNDVTVGDNVVPGEVGTDYQATSGYDLATGLGSVNVGNLLSNWNSVTFNPTTTTFSMTPPANLTHGTSVSFNATVSPNSGNGIPTGDVSLAAYTGPNEPGYVGLTLSGLYTLAGGVVNGSTAELPGGGPYWLNAIYSGDANYAPSTSLAIQVTVSPEPSTTTLSVLTANQSGQALPFTSGPFGSFVYLRADVAGLSGQGVPTGNVTFADTFGPIPSSPTTFNLNSQGNTAFPSGIYNFDTGSHTVSASYSGDPSFNASSTTQSQTFTITPGFLAAIPSNQVVVISAPGSSRSTSVSVSSSTGFSGTITLSCSALPTGAACQFSPSSIQAAGTPATTASTITVTTTAVGAMLRFRGRPLFGNWLAMSGLMFVSVVLVGASGRRRLPLLLATLLALLMLAPGCGGGSSTPAPPPPPPSTSTGTYNIVVTASSGSTTSSTGFTLVVQ